jgi:hypothetical protein
LSGASVKAKKPAGQKELTSVGARHAIADGLGDEEERLLTISVGREGAEKLA